MMYEFISSTEQYKGYILEVHKYRVHDLDSFHRMCRVFKDGTPLAICKTKKEAKDLIDHDCFRPFMR